MEERKPCCNADSATTAAENATSGKVLVISTESLGRGDEELGHILVRSLLNALAESPALPAKIVLLNGGVRLACEVDDTVDALSRIAARGVEVMACGTCLKYFGLIDKLRAGRVSNAHEILAATLGGSTLHWA